MSFQRKLNTLALHKALKEKCKVVGCKKPKRVSGHCKTHEVMSFLDHLRKNFKKLFGNLDAGLEALKKESGPELTSKDLCSFLNFLMISYSNEHVVSLFETLGKKSYKNLNFVIDFKKLKNHMEKSRQKYWMLDEVSEKYSSYKESLQTLIKEADNERSDDSNLFNERKRNFPIEISKRSFLSEKNEFEGLFPQNSKDESEMTDRIDGLAILGKESDGELFSPKSQPNRDLSKETNLFSPKEEESDEDYYVSYFKEKLKEKFGGFEEAFNTMSINYISVGYFEILHELKEFDMVADDPHVKQIIMMAGDQKKGVIYLQTFKEFWLGKRHLCNFSSCTKNAIENGDYCFIHQKISNNKASSLLGRIKLRTNSWKSPRQTKQFFNQLEQNSHEKSLNSLKNQVSLVMTRSEVTTKDIRSLKVFMNNHTPKEIEQIPSRISLPSPRNKFLEIAPNSTRNTSISTPRVFTPKGAGYFCRQIKSAGLRNRQCKGSFIVTNKNS
ncbi:unnamed protein product [Blepharisma stoltei]|uniref:Zinc finger Mcm10/DnaG-type domain-containing protein n=1 Tax=Blepharisma stoltei TaxID=1481888 RepID=A0AAU9K851_9CILI|nr:unnamed protein product [Blepharisma stoltei]